MNQVARCIFCFAESGDRVERSREHLLSRPVADAFGVDREATFLRLDWSDPSSQTTRRLDGISLRRVCRRCNSGWMNRLEHGMKSVAAWLRGPDDRIGESRELVLRRWAIKTHVLLCFLEGEAAEFTSNPENNRAVVPPMTLARELYEGSEESIRAVPIGLARSDGDAGFGTAFGHPTMRRTGPKHWNARFSPASVVTIGDLQIWVVTPHLDADVWTPGNVTPLSESTRPSELRRRPHPTTVSEVVVDYGADHDAEALIAELCAWAAAQDGEP